MAKDRKYSAFLKEFAKDKLALFSAFILIIFIFMAVFAPVLSTFRPYNLQNIRAENNLLPPGSKERISLPRLRFNLDMNESGSFDAPQGLNFSQYIVNTTADQIIIRFMGEDVGFETMTIQNVPAGFSVYNAKRHPITKAWDMRDVGDELVFVGTKNSDLKPITITAKPTPHYTGRTFILGTDSNGRDLFSAILYGARTSLYVGLVSGFVALFIGVVIGLVSAWYGGRVDSIFMRLVDLQQSFPAILTGLLILAILGNGLFNVILALIIVQWVFYVRTVRSIVLVEKNKEYVQMARVMQLSTPKILFSHILPNCMPQILVLATARIATAITLEATYSYLGMGLPATKPSLGSLIANGYEYILSGKFWISLYPGLVLAVLIIVVNLVGDRLRDMINPFLKA